MARKILDWVKTFSKANPSERTRMKRLLLEGILHFHPEQKINEIGKDYKKENALSRDFHSGLIDRSKTEFVGFTIGLEYFKENGGDKESHEALFVHPFGGPMLVYKIKDLPALIVTGPSLRFNHTHVKEISLNKYLDAVLGVTD